MMRRRRILSTSVGGDAACAWYVVVKASYSDSQRLLSKSSASNERMRTIVVVEGQEGRCVLGASVSAQGVFIRKPKRGSRRRCLL